MRAWGRSLAPFCVPFECSVIVSASSACGQAEGKKVLVQVLSGTAPRGTIRGRLFNRGLRIQLGEKECIDVQESIFNKIGLAIAAKITIGIQQICSRYEGLLKLHWAEFHLRKHPLPHSKMKEYQYRTFVLLFRFMAKRIVDFL